MRLDPFTGETYQGDIVETTCDSWDCDNHTTYEQCAYGTDVLVLCDECSPKGDLPEVSTTLPSCDGESNCCPTHDDVDEYPF